MVIHHKNVIFVTFRLLSLQKCPLCKKSDCTNAFSSLKYRRSSDSSTKMSEKSYFSKNSPYTQYFLKNWKRSSNVDFLKLLQYRSFCISGYCSLYSYNSGYHKSAFYKYQLFKTPTRKDLAKFPNHFNYATKKQSVRYESWNS